MYGHHKPASAERHEKDTRKHGENGQNELLPNRQNRRIRNNHHQITERHGEAWSSQTPSSQRTIQTSGILINRERKEAHGSAERAREPNLT